MKLKIKENHAGVSKCLDSSVQVDEPCPARCVEA